MFKSNDLINYWNRAARDYNNNFSLQKDYVNKIQSLFSQNFSSNTHKIFDCGTGNGKIALALAQKNYELIAGDISYAMINEAKRNSENFAIKLQYLILDAESLPFKDGCFDAVVSDAMLYTTINPNPVVKEWYRILKPNGKLAYIDGNLYALPKIIMKIPIIIIKVIEKMLGDSEPLYGSLLESIWSKDVKRPHYDKILLKRIGFDNIYTINHIDLRVFKSKRFFIRGWVFPIFFVSAKK